MVHFRELAENGADAKQNKKKKAAQELAAPVELFNIAQDPSEKNNLAAQEPECVQELRQRLDAYARAAACARKRSRANVALAKCPRSGATSRISKRPGERRCKPDVSSGHVGA